MSPRVVLHSCSTPLGWEVHGELGLLPLKEPSLGRQGRTHRRILHPIVLSPTDTSHLPCRAVAVITMASTTPAQRWAALPSQWCCGASRMCANG